MTVQTKREIPPPPVGRQFNWRLSLIIAIAVGIMLLILFPLVHSQLGFPDINGVFQVDMKSLGDFSFDQYRGTEQDIPKRFRELDGKEVALEGFMWGGGNASDRVKDFQFIYNVSRSYGAPTVQERVFVYAAKPVPNYYDVCRIVGTLHVKVVRVPEDGGRVLSIYTMDLDHIEQL